MYLALKSYGISHIAAEQHVSFLENITRLQLLHAFNIIQRPRGLAQVRARQNASQEVSLSFGTCMRRLNSRAKKVLKDIQRSWRLLLQEQMRGHERNKSSLDVCVYTLWLVLKVICLFTHVRRCRGREVL